MTSRSRNNTGMHGLRTMLGQIKGWVHREPDKIPKQIVVLLERLLKESAGSGHLLGQELRMVKTELERLNARVDTLSQVTPVIGRNGERSGQVQDGKR